MFTKSLALAAAFAAAASAWNLTVYPGDTCVDGHATTGDDDKSCFAIGTICAFEWTDAGDCSVTYFQPSDSGIYPYCPDGVKEPYVPQNECITVPLSDYSFQVSCEC